MHVPECPPHCRGVCSRRKKTTPCAAEPFNAELISKTVDLKQEFLRMVSSIFAHRPNSGGHHLPAGTSGWVTSITTYILTETICLNFYIIILLLLFQRQNGGIQWSAGAAGPADRTGAEKPIKLRLRIPK